MASIQERSPEYDVDVLNGLIETTLDSVDGYEAAAQDARDPRFATMFSTRAGQRRAVLDGLRNEVSRLGGDPEDEGSVLAAAHRRFLGIRQALSQGDQAVVDEVERGEDFIRERFERAMADPRVSSATRQLVARYYDSVRLGHDRARALQESGAATRH
ncbi:MAG: PA2169 family four-helix-bundle protein [Steroidobacteraceae bacterium]|jgi:uncharacterized protein (TIGR02284 family)